MPDASPTDHIADAAPELADAMTPQPAPESEPAPEAATEPAPEPAAGRAPDPLADEAVALVRRWLRTASQVPVSASAAQLAGVLRDPAGLPFVVGFVDGVIRPEDRRVAAHRLRELAQQVPAFLPPHLRAAVRLGGALAPVAPDVVVPVARAALRRMLAHLVVDATPARLDRAIRRLKGSVDSGVRLNVNLLGEAVLGEREAARRLRGTRRLLARDDVDYVSIKVSAVTGPHSPWAFDETVERTVAALDPLYRLAAGVGRDGDRATSAKFVNLDMEEYHDLDLTLAVFMRLLDQPHLRGLEAGVVLQAYLPDALGAMVRVQEWAARRRAAGGAPVKVRLVKGANLPMERVEAQVHGWPLATWGSKRETDTSYLAVLRYALTPERVANVRLGVAGHNLFDVAYAWLLAGARGVRAGMDVEMLLGMAQGQAEAVRRDTGGLLLYTPVVSPREFDSAIAYLVRRLEEGASSDNFMSAVFELGTDEALFARERDRFVASLAALPADQAGPDLAVPDAAARAGSTTAPSALPWGPHRVADRYAATSPAAPGAFENVPDTDPAVAEHRAWAADVRSRVPGSRLGVDAIEAARVTDAATLDAVVTDARAAGAAWGERAASDRAAVLDRVGEVLEAHRGELLEVMAAEAGKTIDQGDPEVSEAVDFAHWYAQGARELEHVDGATFVPAHLTVVTPPWNFPVSIPAGGVLAALAAGSAVVLKPAPPAERCGALLAELCWEAGVPRDVLRLVQVDERTLGSRLVAHEGVDRVILTGAYETAELFRSLRPDLPLLAETSGKNAIVVTPTADLDLAVRDVVASAFGHAGQKCSAASLVVLVGSVARSRRFHDQLIDAASSLVVGLPQDARTQMGPLVEPAAGKLLAGLTELGPGESWALEPRRLDDAGTLWTPGIRAGVRPGSTAHRVELFGPVLSVMTAATLDDAIDLVNAVDFGLTSGLHSLDADEIGRWLARVEAGNLYVNRGITGAIVRRQPFGGWKRSAVGPGTKAGGPSYLFALGSWREAPATRGADVTSSAVRDLVAAVRADLGDDVASLERAVRSDAHELATTFAASDVTGLEAERNVLRYLPYPDAVLVRLAPPADGALAVTRLVRVVAAATAAGAHVLVSSAVPLPAHVDAALRSTRAVDAVRVEDDAAWSARLATHPGAARVRLVGATSGSVARATGGRPDVAVWDHDVTEAGRVELLPFLREQAVSVTAHRFGTPDHLTDEVLPVA